MENLLFVDNLLKDKKICNAESPHKIPDLKEYEKLSIVRLLTGKWLYRPWVVSNFSRQEKRGQNAKNYKCVKIRDH